MTRPAWLRRWPDRTFTRVLLPAPFGPISPVIDPRCTLSDALSTAWIPPNDTDTPSQDKIASRATSVVSCPEMPGRTEMPGRSAVSRSSRRTRPGDIVAGPLSTGTGHRALRSGDDAGGPEPEEGDENQAFEYPLDGEGQPGVGRDRGQERNPLPDDDVDDQGAGGSPPVVPPAADDHGADRGEDLIQGLGAGVHSVMYSASSAPDSAAIAPPQITTIIRIRYGSFPRAIAAFSFSRIAREVRPSGDRKSRSLKAKQMQARTAM